MSLVENMCTHPHSQGVWIPNTLEVFVDICYSLADSKLRKIRGHIAIERVLPVLLSAVQEQGHSRDMINRECTDSRPTDPSVLGMPTSFSH